MAMSIAEEEVHDSNNSSPTVIAINRDKNSQYAVKWAVENLLNRRKASECILIHVRHQSLHPQDVDTVPKEDHPPTEAELHQFFLPYRGFCARKGILAKELILHDIDVPSALIDYVTNHSISNIVVGASSRNAIIRRFKHPDVPTTLLRSTPESCSVFVIARGKVHSKKLGTRSDGLSTPTGSSPIERSLSTPPTPQHHTYSDTPASRDKSRKLQIDVKDRHGFDISYDSPSSSADSCNSVKSPYLFSLSDTSDFSGPLSFKSIGETSSENLDYSFASETGSRSSISSPTPSSLETEMRKLRSELKHIMDIYDSACKDAVVAKLKAREFQHSKMEREKNFELVKSAEEAMMALAEIEKQKTKAANEAALMAQRLAELESHKRRNAEMKAMSKVEEKKVVDLFEQRNFCYRRYTIEEIEVATDYFNETNKIGEGGYGPVYKAMLEYTNVAVKILRPDRSHGQRQFQQEIEVLSCMRHPHMVLLVGACPEYGCLVYEYMENGSLEDRLFQRNNTPPIPWRTRFKIAAEIATALLFLHQMKPEPLVHRDLKPANILLDKNYVSKIGDVGLARLVPPSVADSVTQYHMTAAAGTFCYIDPEYQQTGMLGVKSDIYSFGVLLLQLITAKPPMGLSYQIEEAIKNGSFSEILDPAVTDWPVDEALVLAKIALKCCELRKRDRPELRSDILPELIRLRDIESSDEATDGLSNINAYAGRPCNSDDHLQISTENEIYVRKRWQRLKLRATLWSQKGIAAGADGRNVRKLWSFKNSLAKASLLPPSRKQDVEEDKKQTSERCWSLVSCASATATTLGLKTPHSFA